MVDFGQFEAICIRQSRVMIFMQLRRAVIIFAIKENPASQHTVERHKHNRPIEFVAIPYFLE